MSASHTIVHGAAAILLPLLLADACATPPACDEEDLEGRGFVLTSFPDDHVTSGTMIVGRDTVRLEYVDETGQGWRAVWRVGEKRTW